MRMKKISRNCVIRIAAGQWTENRARGGAGVLASAAVTGLALFWASFEKGRFAGLIVSCALLALYLIRRHISRPACFCLEALRAAGAEDEQIRQVMFWQMSWMFLAAIPLGIALFCGLKGAA